MRQHRKLCTNKKTVTDRGSRSNILNKTLPRENINEDPQSFQGTNHLQKEVPPSLKLQLSPYE